MTYVDFTSKSLYDETVLVPSSTMFHNLPYFWSKQWLNYDFALARGYLGTRVNPPYRRYIQGKLFLDIVPSSSADNTRALRGCFRGGSVYVVSFRFVSKQRKTSNAVGMSSSVTFWLQARELRLSVCSNTFRNFNRILNKWRMSPVQTITTKWTAGKCFDKQVQSNANNRPNAS